MTFLHSRKSVSDVLHNQDRLAEIVRLNLVSTEVDAILQATVDEAAQHFHLPISLVSIILDDAQYFAAMHGLGGWLEEVRGTPIEWSFCVRTVESRKAFVVEDATTHAEVSGNPLVTIDGVRCYAGIPLISSRGFAVGSLCVVGGEARSFSDQEIEELTQFAAHAMQQIENRVQTSTVAAC